jgi:hypothetical protein
MKNMKKLFALLLLIIGLQSVTIAQTVNDCIKKNPTKKEAKNAKEVLGENFNIKNWATQLHSWCDETVRKKSNQRLIQIADQEKVIDALLDLNDICADNKDLRNIKTELLLLKKAYKKVGEKKTDKESTEGGLGGLFDDEETTEAGASIARIRTIRLHASQIKTSFP